MRQACRSGLPENLIMSCAGVNIGALSVKVVALDGERREARVALHCGRPVETLKEMLAQPEFAGVEYFGVSGQLGHLTEVAAIRRALRELEEEFRCRGLAGGRGLPGLFSNARTDHQCAFPQQMRRRQRGVFCAANRPDGTGKLAWVNLPPWSKLKFPSTSVNWKASASSVPWLIVMLLTRYCLLTASCCNHAAESRKRDAPDFDILEIDTVDRLVVAEHAQDVEIDLRGRCLELLRIADVNLAQIQTRRRQETPGHIA